MININFVNTGADEAILKSMDTENCSEELVKAMNKQGLVQKEIQVKGKNGTFTRKQWVSASDDSTSGTSTAIPKRIKDYYDLKGTESIQELEQIRTKAYNLMKKTFKNYQAADKAGKPVAQSLGISAGGQQQLLMELDDYIQKVKVDKTADGLKNPAGNSTSKTDSITDAKKQATHALDNCDVGDKLGNGDNQITTGRKRNNNTGDWEMTYTTKAGKQVSYKEAVEILTQSYSDTQAQKTSQPSQSQSVSLVSKIVGIPKFGQVTYSDKDTFEFSDDVGNKVSGMTCDPNDIKVGDTILLYNGMHIMGVGTVKDWEVVTTNRHSPHERQERSFTCEDANGKIFGGTGGSSIAKVTKVEPKQGKKTDDLPKTSTGSIDWNKMVQDGDFTAEQKSELSYGVSEKHACVVEKDGKIKTTKDWDEADYAEKNGWKNLGSVTEILKQGKLPAQTKQDTQPQQPKTIGTKLSKEDAKKKTQEYSSKIGKSDQERKAFMEKVQAQGITWKNKNDDGTEASVAIGWMRCLMAMNKHFADGGSFNG